MCKQTDINYDLDTYRLIALSEELILKTCNAKSIQGIQVLNLHGNGLTKLKGIQSMHALKKLIVSFNELTRLDDVAQTVSLTLFTK